MSKEFEVHDLHIFVPVVGRASRGLIVVFELVCCSRKRCSHVYSKRDYRMNYRQCRAQSLKRMMLLKWDFSHRNMLFHTSSIDSVEIRNSWPKERWIILRSLFELTPEGNSLLHLSRIERRLDTKHTPACMSFPREFLLSGLDFLLSKI